MEGGGSNTHFYRGSTTALATNPSSAANGPLKGDKEAAVDAEIARVNKLPAHSSYAMHRMKVLNKLRHLLSIKDEQRMVPGSRGSAVTAELTFAID
ncbi:unnamed protein product [Urochloa humidicola]